MYNRYVRNDEGVYRRIPQAQSAAPLHNKKEQDSSGARRSAASSGKSAGHYDATPGKDGLLSGILGKLRLDEIDSGDLLLLVLLFLLFRESEDEELLIALGLLLIL